jgi:AraC-like DNA-binding protein/mannose-6-phosphate isomerase-like protein (cupin superfamily)
MGIDIRFVTFSEVRMTSVERYPLPFHIDRGEDLAEVYELGTPYLVMSQVTDPREDTCRFDVLSAEECMRQRLSYADYRALRESHGMHQHGFYELTVVLSGTFRETVGDREVALHAGDALLLNRNVRHWEDIDSRCEVAFVMLSGEMLPGLLKTVTHQLGGGGTSPAVHMVLRGERSRYYSAEEYVTLSPQGDGAQRLCRTLRGLTKELVGRRVGFRDVSRGLLCRALGCLLNADLYRQEPHRLDGRNDDAIFNQVTTLFEREGPRVSRPCISRELGYNADYLNQIVRTHTGMSLCRYGRQIALDRAARMLAEGGCTVGEAMARAGFTNRTRFNALFRQTYGRLPGRRREDSPKVDAPKPAEGTADGTTAPTGD